MINNVGQPQINTRPGVIKKTYNKVKTGVKKSIEAVDNYTRPRESTGGNLKKGSYFQACVTGATDGFYTMGPAGIIAGAAPAAIGVAVTNKTGSTTAGVAAGAVSGAATAAGIGFMLGGPAGAAGGAITGCLLGTMETFRGSSESQTRDGAGNANMISAAFVPGPAKLAGGLGSAVGTRMKSKTAKAVVGGTTAAAIGGTLAAVGFAPVSIPVAIAACGAAGVLGPFLGPRYSQLFRNLSNDLGKLITKGGKKVGLIKEDAPETTKASNVAGTIPASMAKEVFRGMALSGGNIPKMAIGAAVSAVKDAHLFLTQKNKGKEGKKELSPAQKEKLEVSLNQNAEALGILADKNAASAMKPEDALKILRVGDEGQY